MGKPPKTPDPYQTAQAQSNANFTNAQQNAVMGNVNEYNPYGSKTYKQIGWDPVYDSQGRMTYAPRYQSEVQLSPDQQRLLGIQTGTQYNIGNLGLSQSARLQSLLGKEMNTQGLQGWKAAGAPGAVQGQIANQNVRQDQAPTDRAAVEQAMMSRYNQDAARQAASQDAQLAARGLNVGSQGYADVAQQRDRARTDALQQAYLGSGQESRAAQDAYNQAAAQRFQQGAAMGQFANQAALQKYQMGTDYASQLNNLRQGQLQERMALRNQPVNEIMALLGGSGVTTPQFQPFNAPSVQGTNIGQMIYDSTNMRNQNSQNAMSGMFGIGANIAGALPWASWLSDRRLKTDIKPLHKMLAGVPLYSFRYKKHKVVPEKLWGTLHIGVMADECKAIHPDVVRRCSDGYDRVDYSLLKELEAA